MDHESDLDILRFNAVRVHQIEKGCGGLELAVDLARLTSLDHVDGQLHRRIRRQRCGRGHLRDFAVVRNQLTGMEIIQASAAGIGKDHCQRDEKKRREVGLLHGSLLRVVS